jgi:AcrR family transcriptional regulator
MTGGLPRGREAHRPGSTVYGYGVRSSKSGEPPARPVRRRLAPDDRRQALINSALKLFNTYPYDEVSVDDIAADAGMSRPLVYHYYGGKAGVFITALRQTGEDVVAAIYEAGVGDLDNWLAAGLAAFFDHIQANPIALTALLRHGSLAGPLTGGEDRQVLDEIRDRVLTLILACLGSPGDSAVLQSVLRGWIAMVETMGREWLRWGEPTREELETLLPELLRAVLGTAAWHDAAVAAVLPRLPPLKPAPGLRRGLCYC